MLVAIIKKRLNANASLHTILQALSLTLFEFTPIEHLLATLNQTEQYQSSPPQFALLEEISGQ